VHIPDRLPGFRTVENIPTYLPTYLPTKSVVGET
jgi:hypothetical protein